MSRPAVWGDFLRTLAIGSVLSSPEAGLRTSDGAVRTIVSQSNKTKYVSQAERAWVLGAPNLVGRSVADTAITSATCAGDTVHASTLLLPAGRD